MVQRGKLIASSVREVAPISPFCWRGNWRSGRVIDLPMGSIVSERQSSVLSSQQSWQALEGDSFGPYALGNFEELQSCFATVNTDKSRDGPFHPSLPRKTDRGTVHGFPVAPWHHAPLQYSPTHSGPRTSFFGEGLAQTASMLSSRCGLTKARATTKGCSHTTPGKQAIHNNEEKPAC